jgi:hypothetical protein
MKCDGSPGPAEAGSDLTERRRDCRCDRPAASDSASFGLFAPEGHRRRGFERSRGRRISTRCEPRETIAFPRSWLDSDDCMGDQRTCPSRRQRTSELPRTRSRHPRPSGDHCGVRATADEGPRDGRRGRCAGARTPELHMQAGDSYGISRSPAIGDERVCHSVSPHDRFGLPVGAQADEGFGDISITPVVASWHEPRNCFRVGRGAGRAMAMPRKDSRPREQPARVRRRRRDDARAVLLARSLARATRCRGWPP